jgi:pimeloyl-ACP methyl ester carboxylesterase
MSSAGERKFLTVYFISGLGADRRIFARLKLPPEIRIKYIDWIEPLKKESLIAYCKRLAVQVDAKDDFVLAGLSFGGMVAIELSRMLQPRLIILISSIATRNELPLHFRLVRNLKLNRITPAWLMKLPRPFIYWIFNARTKGERLMLRSFLENVSNPYLKWSINEVVNWENEQRPVNLFHIHGSSDRIFPYKNIHADVRIEDGGHLMVYDKAGEISKILSEKLNRFMIHGSPPAP